MKKAFLVEYNIKTRVVVDVPEDYEPSSELTTMTDSVIVAKADDKILSDAQGYIVGDNIVSIGEDIEMPYDAEYDEPKTEEPQRYRHYCVLLRGGDYLKKNGNVIKYNSEEEANLIAKDMNGIVVSWEDLECQ